MAYTYDADLEFLGECTDEQLKDLAEVLIYDKDGKTRNVEEITGSNEYKRYGARYSKYWEVLAGDLQKFGGNTFFDIAGPAMRVTLPACVVVACLRKTIIYQKSGFKI